MPSTSDSATQPTTAAEHAPTADAPMRILFLCTHNSSRSQMAEGLLRGRGGSGYAAFSAGTRPGGINPFAIRAMAEIGIDISEAAGHSSKGLDAYAGQTFDLVVTVCDSAAEECPFFPGARRQTHWGFPDPAAVEGSEGERLAAFREVRDAIGARLDAFLAERSGR